MLLTRSELGSGAATLGGDVAGAIVRTIAGSRLSVVPLLRPPDSLE